MSDRAPGWIRVHRSMGDPLDRIWNDPEPFDVRSARLDLLLQARFAPGPFSTHYGVDELQRGEFVGSLRFWARRWGWSVKRVRLLFQRLTDAGFLRAQRGARHGRVYLIVNYERYQSVDAIEGTDEGTGRAQEGHRKGTKDKKERRETTSCRASHDTWLTPYLDAWQNQHHTSLSPGKAAGSLRAVENAIGTEECLARWRRYLLDAPLRTASPARFAETHTAYAGRSDADGAGSDPLRRRGYV